MDDENEVMNEEPKLPKRPRDAPWAKHDSIALIASRNGQGCVLVYDGAGIQADIEKGVGSTDIEQLGLDDAPDGLSIWEGKLMVWREREGEYDSDLKGTFRSLTEEEWENFRSTGKPWTYAPQEIEPFSTLEEALAIARTEYFGETEQESLGQFLSCEAFECRMDSRRARAFKAAAIIIKYVTAKSECTTCSGTKIVSVHVFDTLTTPGQCPGCKGKGFVTPFKENL